MALLVRRILLPVAMAALALSAAAVSARADEIRLKDGKKLYGVIVAYEDNMFKVKTDFGYVLVEKDKIASIIPSTPANETPKTDKSTKAPATKKEAPADAAEPKTEPAVATSTDGTPGATNASVKSVDPAAKAKITNAAVKPEVPASTKKDAVAPSVSAPAGAPATALTASAAQPPAPAPPAMREEIQGNLYTNYTHGFRMYKAPSWELIEDARQALPNAIVALGTYDQSTLMVVGQEKTKEPLEPAAMAVEGRLHDIYDNYRRISQKRTTIGGLSAMEYHYRGMADGHDWSGTLTVIARGNDIFTVLGMTYADNDLIQIQENVIARAIASLDFSVR
ncbi:MAG TPA: hypothetical protein VE077_12345 [Candidatus Methylomirabilis sp.]|nr:hypothetical protein [Candidatus Methylomirabilis sp.]